MNEVFKRWKALLFIGIVTGLIAHAMVWLGNLSPPYIPSWTAYIYIVIVAILASAYLCSIDEVSA